MSYNVAVCLPPIPGDDTRAWAEVDAMIEAKGPVPPAFVQLHAILTQRFPCLCDLPDDEVDDSVWSDGPLIENFGHRAAVLGFVYSGVAQGLPFLVESANRLGMVVFDWATETIHRPQPT